VRFLRLVRIIRVLRVVHFMQELNRMVYLIIGSLWSCFWTVSLLFLLTYMVSVFLTQLICDTRDSAKDSDERLLRGYYGSIGDSILSLFQAISGGIDWKDLLDPVMSLLGPGVCMIFVFYIAFAMLVMLNLVTGVFVEGAHKLTQEDRDKDLKNKMFKLFSNSSGDDGVMVTYTEFRQYLNNPMMLDVFNALKIDIEHAETLFILLDEGLSGEIPSEDFVYGAIRLIGPARAFDLATLHLAMVEERKEINANFQTIQDQLNVIGEATGVPARAMKQIKRKHKGGRRNLGSTVSWHRASEFSMSP